MTMTAPGPRTHYLPGQELVDWTLVSQLRLRASEQLSEAVTAHSVRLPQQMQEELGKAIIIELLEATNADRVRAGQPAWSPAQHRAMQRALFDALFRLGRLQPLVDDDRVENILIDGYDRVMLELDDGEVVGAPPVAESDEELIEFLVFLASRSQVNARTFSPAQPSLHLRLDGGSRLAATAWVTARPAITIRRHRIMRVTLDDLVARTLMTPLAASFVAAAVRARKSIVVTGAQGAGKTTLVRALCSQIDPREAIGTFETEYELHLHEFPDQHHLVRAWEARPGTGERLPDGSIAGEYGLDLCLYDSFRFNLSRQIVGEVRGKEIWTMIKAMESGTGSISTTHAAGARQAIDKLVTCAVEAGSHVSDELAAAKLAQTIDLVIHVDLSTTIEPDGTWRRHRKVTEIVAVARGERASSPAFTDVFRAGPDGVAVPHVLPEEYRSLANHGFDLTGFVKASRPAERERP